MSSAGSRDGFGSPPWGPADPVRGGKDETQELPALGGAGQDPRAASQRPAVDETSVDAFTPINRMPSDQGSRPAGTQSAATGSAGTRWAGGEAAGGQLPRRRAADARTLVDGIALDRAAEDSATYTRATYNRVTANRAAENWAGEGQGAQSDAGEDEAAGGNRGSRAGGSHRAGRASRRRRPRSFLSELALLVVIALTLTLVIKTFVVQAFYIPTGSMQNTLPIGDRIVVNKLVYHTRGIARGDIVVFDGTGSWIVGNPAPANPLARFWNDLTGIFGETSGDTDNIFVKRVIGLPGDRVACCTAAGQVTVNGVALAESGYLYPGNQPSQQRFAVVVPPGRLWVMGDHREVSYDSRGHMGDPGGGTIPESGVIGRAFAIIWPISQSGFLNIPATFEQPKLTHSAASGAAASGTANGSSAVLAAALRDGTPIRQAWTPFPLALGFAVAIPVSWLQRRVRRRVADRWTRQSPGGRGSGWGRSVWGKRGGAAAGQ